MEKQFELNEGFRNIWALNGSLEAGSRELIWGGGMKLNIMNASWRQEAFCDEAKKQQRYQIRCKALQSR